MDDMTVELNELFAAPNTKLDQDVLGELQSMMRIHSLSPQELFFKWEAYSIKMGPDSVRIDYKTSRDFKKDLQDAVERDSRGKAHVQSATKRNMAATPRNAATGDVFGVLDSLVTGTPTHRGAAMKRRGNDFGTPSAKATKTTDTSSPAEQRTPTLGATADPQPAGIIPFSERQRPGEIIEQLNGNIQIPAAPESSPEEARVKLKANTELPKFAYRPMAMKLSEASEILDDRIDEFVAIVQEHHKFPDSAFGNPAAQSPSEIIAVGRIASDSPEGRLNAASLVLETSRRMGAGLRVPLRVDNNKPYDFFPGKIVALRGINPSGEFFSVSEVIPTPTLPLPATHPTDLDIHNERLQSNDGSETRPLNIIVGAGPYTTEADLDFSTLHELCSQAATTKADLLILSGPFLDIEHPKLASGDFTLPQDSKVDPETATTNDLFRALISAPLTKLTQQHPSITIVLVPSVRDAISNHVSYPQDRLPRKVLGLPKQATCVTNPMTLSANDTVIGITSADILYEIQRQRIASSSNNLTTDTLATLSQSLLSQRHYFPVFPPLQPRTDGKLEIGASLDVSYLKLAEMVKVAPDLLIVPSVLTPFVRVVDSVVVVNPGNACKKRGFGSFARLVVGPREVGEDERESGEPVSHELFKRARVDVVRI